MKLSDDTLPLNKVLSELKQHWLENLQRRKITKRITVKNWHLFRAAFSVTSTESDEITPE